MPTNEKPTITVNDARAVAPPVSRRLFQLERSFDPVLVSASAPVRRVILHLPDSGAHRDRGPGRYASGRVLQVIHEPGCPFPRLPCDGGPACSRVPSVDEMSDDVLRDRISDLAYLFRTQPETRNSLPIRVAELDALQAALAAREPGEAIDG
jgi:hypothetical protein